MNTLKIPNFSFKFVKLPFISRNPQSTLPTAGIYSGDAGLTLGLMSLKIKANLKQNASAVLALHPDSDVLKKFKKQAGKYLPKHKIFCIKTSAEGSGNGKDPDICMDDWGVFNLDLQDTLPRFVKEANDKGTTCIESISGSGGSFPAWLHAIHITQKYFKYHVQMVTEPLDRRAAGNIDGLLSCLENDFDGLKNRLIFAKNPTGLEEMDFANATILNSVTLGNQTYDVSDNFGKNAILPRSSSLRTGFQHVPERLDLFGNVQDLNKVRATTRSLLRQLEINPAEDICVIAGRIMPQIVKQVGDAEFDRLKNDIQIKIGKLKIKDWNTVGGRFRKKVVPFATATAVERLRSKWAVEAEKKE